MAQRADDEATPRGLDEVAESGGKRSWDRTVDSIPSSRDKDPKDHEPNRGDMSVRDGDLGPGARRPGSHED